MEYQKIESYFDTNPDRDWLNPISMSTLQKAVENKRENVKLNGVEYSIELVTWKSKVIGDYPVVKLTRTDGFYAPFGYISLKRIREFDFEKGE